MNAQLLVDAIVRRTTVLVAQIATSRGLRAPLAHLANQVFYELSRELEHQGVSRKVSADMFGMALRAYLKKIGRARESATVRGQSLWEAVHAYVSERDVVSRREVIDAFAEDEEASIRAVLYDLVDSGLVFAAGPPTNVSYRAADASALGKLSSEGERRIDELLWALIHLEGPIARTDLARFGGVSEAQLDGALDRLVEDGRVTRDAPSDGGEPSYRSRRFYIPIGEEVGWAGSVLDHYGALVQTICAKLQRDELRAAPDDRTGGSTYRLVVWEGHPFEEEASAFLPRFREELGRLRDRIEEYGRSHPRPDKFRRIVVYGGQCVTEEEFETC